MVSLGAGLCGPDVDDQPKVQMAPNALLLLLHTEYPPLRAAAKSPPTVSRRPALWDQTQSKSHIGLQ